MDSIVSFFMLKPKWFELFYVYFFDGWIERRVLGACRQMEIRRNGWSRAGELVVRVFRHNHIRTFKKPAVYYNNNTAIPFFISFHSMNIIWGNKHFCMDCVSNFIVKLALIFVTTFVLFSASLWFSTALMHTWYPFGKRLYVLSSFSFCSHCKQTIQVSFFFFLFSYEGKLKIIF